MFHLIYLHTLLEFAGIYIYLYICINYKNYEISKMNGELFILFSLIRKWKNLRYSLISHPRFQSKPKGFNQPSFGGKA